MIRLLHGAGLVSAKSIESVRYFSIDNETTWRVAVYGKQNICHFVEFSKESLAKAYVLDLELQIKIAIRESFEPARRPDTD